MKSISFIFLGILLGLTSFAQTSTNSGPDIDFDFFEIETENQNPKLHTYEEAIKLLSNDSAEFIEKGKSVLPSVGKQIREARMEKGASLEAIAFVTQLETTDILKIENDEVTPTREIILKIEDFLGEDIVLH